MFIPAMLLAQPAGKKTIVGVWKVKMAPVGQSPQLSLAMYSSDGSFTMGDGYKAVPSIPAVQEVGSEASPGYGRWAAAGDREQLLGAIEQTAATPAASTRDSNTGGWLACEWADAKPRATKSSS